MSQEVPFVSVIMPERGADTLKTLKSVGKYTKPALRDEDYQLSKRRCGMEHKEVFIFGPRGIK